MSDAAVLVVAALFAGMGAGALVRPAMIPDQFGERVVTAEGRNEIRAVYGGFGLAVAALLAVAAIGDPATAEGIIVTVAFALLGMAGGRLAGAVVERPGAVYPVWVYFASEVVGGGLLLAAAWA